MVDKKWRGRCSMKDTYEECITKRSAFGHSNVTMLVVTNIRLRRTSSQFNIENYIKNNEFCIVIIVINLR